MSLQIDRLSVAAESQRLLHQIQRHRSGERIGDDEWRRSQIVCPHVRIDPPLKIAIAGENRDSNEVIARNGVRYFLLQRSGVSNAGGATEADQIKSEFIEIGLKTCLLEIFRHDLRARRERGLDPRFGGQALGNGVARQQAGRQHDAGVGGIRARRNRCDHDIAMAEIEIFTLDAMPVTHLLGLAEFLIHGAQKRGLRGIERHAILWPFRSGQRRHDVGHVELQDIREHRIRGIGGAPHALGFGIGLDQRDASGIAAGGRQIIDRSLVDREEAAGCAIFRRHIGDGGAVRHRHVIEPRAVELDELANHAPLAQHLRHGQHEIGCSDAFLQPAGQLEADDLRQQHRDLLTEHDGFGLDAADAPTEYGEAIDHRGVRIRADQRIGIGQFDSRHPRPGGSRSSAPGTRD